MTEINNLNPAVTAADYLISALGLDGARLAMIALRADWLTPDEAKDLEPVAAGIAYLLHIDCPLHRGAKATISVVEASAAEASAALLAARMKGEEA